MEFRAAPWHIPYIDQYERFHPCLAGKLIDFVGFLRFICSISPLNAAATTTTKKWSPPPHPCATRCQHCAWLLNLTSFHPRRNSVGHHFPRQGHTSLSEFTPTKKRPKLPPKRKILFKNNLFSGGDCIYLSSQMFHYITAIWKIYNQLSTNIKGELLVKFCSFLKNWFLYDISTTKSPANQPLRE